MERIKKAKNIKNIGKIFKYKKVLNLGRVFQRKNFIKHIPIAGLILTIAIVFFIFRMDILSYTDPIVETHDATDILTTQVKGNGEIISTGGQDIDEIGFEYGLSQEPTWVKNETANTEYWYRAYAKIIAKKMYALIVASPNELQLFDMDGNLVNQIAVAGWSYAGCGVTLDSKGNIYIEENMEVIKKYDSNLNLLVTQNIESGDNWIEGINMGQDGYLYTLEGIASGYDIKKRNVSDLTIQEVIPITSDIWNFHTGTPCLDSNGNFYMVGHDDDIVKYSSTGVLLASIDVGSISNEYAGCGVLGNYVYFVKSTNKIVYLPLNLSTYTDWNLPSSIAYGITVADEHLILSGWDGDNDGATSKYDSDRNLVWTKKLTDAGYAYKAGGYPSPTEYIAYGEWLDFTTAAGLTVETHDATDILTTQVKGNGEIISTGGQDIDEIGFEYGLSQEPTWVKNDK
ncbi:MAG: hypothetical protein NT012_02360 [Candidatus Nealsonbacteria bacterium]|nr:hypothetical protein [Candidatus Nealsonbacteria bacterium]